MSLLLRLRPNPLLCPPDCEHRESYRVMEDRDLLLALDDMKSSAEQPDHHEPIHVQLGWQSPWSFR